MMQAMLVAACGMPPAIHAIGRPHSRQVLAPRRRARKSHPPRRPAARRPRRCATLGRRGTSRRRAQERQEAHLNSRLPRPGSWASLPGGFRVSIADGSANLLPGLDFPPRAGGFQCRPPFRRGAAAPRQEVVKVGAPAARRPASSCAAPRPVSPEGGSRSRNRGTRQARAAVLSACPARRGRPRTAVATGLSNPLSNGSAG